MAGKWWQVGLAHSPGPVADRPLEQAGHARGLGWLVPSIAENHRETVAAGRTRSAPPTKIRARHPISAKPLAAGA